MKKTTVFTNGCYDIIHAGHVRFLQQCKELGDFLVVGINSDESIRSLGKGDDRPIITEAQRVEVLAAIRYVDRIFIFENPTPLKLIQMIKPDILVKGKDWEDKEVVGQEFVESYGGRLELIELLNGISTTEIINRIRGGMS